MSTPEELFFEKLAGITGAARPRAIDAAQAHEDVAHEEAVAKLAEMSTREIMEHPEFRAGFMARLEERRDDLDDAAIQILDAAFENAEG